MYRFVTIAAAVASLAGCATSTTTYGPDGRQSHSLNCSGLARHWGMCLEKAGEICGAKGYDILSHSGDKGMFVQGTSNTSSAQVSGGTVITRTMMVACKP